jgi:hypothetical protein
MAALELLHRYASVVTAPEGTAYAVRAYAAPDPGGGYAAWLVFFPIGGGPALPTDRETTQPDLDAAVYWAGGLEPVYPEGAPARARALDPATRRAVAARLIAASERLERGTA